MRSGNEADQDPLVRQLREQISDNDRAIVEGINKRLELVARLKAYKNSRGYEFIDQAREDWMFSYLSRANRGPLTNDGLREIYGELLDLTKREVSAVESEGSEAESA
jgi:chorismate mutase/prephenate dehydratase